MMQKQSQKIYDAVHGFIHFNALEQKLINTCAFQRLHYIHQLGIAYHVYPGATHTRFEHSLGTMELATRILNQVIYKGFILNDLAYWTQILRFAALAHDLGHLPFSHDAEKELLEPPGHEVWTKKIIESELLAPIWKEFTSQECTNDILKMAIGEKKLLEMGLTLSFSPEERVLSEIITGDFFGADRIDYLLRDAKCTGVCHGLFDYHQLLEMLCVLSFNGKLQLGIEENGLESCEALLLARHFMQQRVYQYSSVKAHKFHLVRFMKQFFATGDYLKNLEAYLSLTDCEIIAAIRSAAQDREALGHEDALALIQPEKRFKAVRVFEELCELKKYVDIPVQLLSGQIVPAHTCSTLSIPQKTAHFVYQVS